MNKEEDNNWQEVKKYKKPKKNVTLKKAWKGFVIGLCFAGLGGCIKIAYDIEKSLKENPMEKITETDEETKKMKPNEAMAKAYFYQYRDQEYLNLITNGSHEEWDALPDEIKDWIRDPAKIAEIKEKQSKDDESEHIRIINENMQKENKQDSLLPKETEIRDSELENSNIVNNTNEEDFAEDNKEEPIIEILDDSSFIYDENNSLDEDNHASVNNPEFEITIEESIIYYPDGTIITGDELSNSDIDFFENSDNERE